ncbi:MAG: MarR family winged helix-turn-helix transcriptional regulator [Chitinophagaceae bacterium]|jgi:DNA-binding MarR family transcriptional regulator|nr:MarR family winged helix-turn-helix transcriptional regulator [Chitinophagaceae bacterium]
MNVNSITSLIREWAAFSDAHPGQTLSQFAVWLLTKNQNGQDYNEGDDIKFKFIELSIILETQAKLILEDASDFQAIRILSILEKEKKARKLDVVLTSLLETSTGFYVLKTLNKRGMIKELPNSSDKRSTVVTLTSYGKKYLTTKRKELQKILLLDGVQSEADRRAFVKTLNQIHTFQKNKVKLKTMN